MSGPCIGIDIGTTSCAVALFDKGRASLIPDRYGENFIPSQVSVDVDGNVYVGKKALDHKNRYNSNSFTYYSVKRFLKKKYLANSYQNNLSPVVITALILAHIKKEAELQIGQQINEAVLCIPCSFGYQEKLALLEAADLVGLKVLNVLNEALAASFSFNYFSRISADDFEEQELIFDLGGGTLDIALLSYWRHSTCIGLEAEYVGGDDSLGGDDFTRIIVNYIIEETKRKYHFHPIEDQIDNNSGIAALRLYEAAEKAKIDLSLSNECQIIIPYIRNILGKAEHIVMDMSGELFRNSTSDLRNRIMLHIEKALEGRLKWIEREYTYKRKRSLKNILLFEHPNKTYKKRTTAKDMPRLILAGRGYKYPPLREEIFKKFSFRSFSERGKQEVAIGASMLSAFYKGHLKDILLFDITPKKISIRLEDGETRELFDEFTVVPARKELNLTAPPRQGNTLKLFLHESSQDKQTDENLVFTIELEMKIGSKPVNKFTLTVDIDARSNLSFSAVDSATGSELNCIKASPKFQALNEVFRDQLSVLLHRWQDGP